MNDYYPLYIGDTVKLATAPYGQGKVTNKDNSNYPFEVTFSDGSRNWFKREEIRRVGQ